VKTLKALGLGLTILTRPQARAVEVTEYQGAAHGYPGFMDGSGKKLADGEFRQWIKDDKLHIVISYKFRDGQFYEESALFWQQPSSCRNSRLGRNCETVSRSANSPSIF
jgi:hypothetical protein